MGARGWGCGAAVGPGRGADAVLSPQGPAAGAVSGGALPAGEEPVHSRIGGSLPSGHPPTLGGSRAQSRPACSLGSPGGPPHRPTAPHPHGAAGTPGHGARPGHRPAVGVCGREGAGPGWQIPASWDGVFVCVPPRGVTVTSPPCSPQPPGSSPGLGATPRTRCLELRSRYSSTKDMLHTLFVCISGE